MAESRDFLPEDARECLRGTLAEECHRDRVDGVYKIFITSTLQDFRTDYNTLLFLNCTELNHCTTIQLDDFHNTFSTNTMRVILMPVGPPGSGKSTLCNGLKQVFPLV
jgi:hypothetical protein